MPRSDAVCDWCGDVLDDVGYCPTCDAEDDREEPSYEEDFVLDEDLELDDEDIE